MKENEKTSGRRNDNKRMVFETMEVDAALKRLKVVNGRDARNQERLTQARSTRKETIKIKLTVSSISTEML